MALPQLGLAGAIALGEESTWGTAVAAVRWMPGTPGSAMKRKREVAPIEYLASGGAAAANLIDFATLSDRCTGSLQGPLIYNDPFITTLLKHVMGSVVDAGSNPYTHTYALALNLPTGLTIRQQNDTYQEIFAGCKVSKMVFTFEARKPSTWSAELIGKTTTGAQSVGTPSYISGRLVGTGDEVGQLTWNSAARTYRKVTITIDNKLAERDELGSLNTAEPTRSSMMEITIDAELYRTDNTMMTAYYAGTQANATFTVQKSASASIAFTCHNGVIVDYEDGYGQDVNGVIEKVKYRFMADATNKGLAIVWTNTQATAI